MAHLVNCSLCKRSVSSECSSCPGCGHNVAGELCKIEYNKKVAQSTQEYNKKIAQSAQWKSQGLCTACGGEIISTTSIEETFETYGPQKWKWYHSQCAKCKYYYGQSFREKTY